MTTSLEDDKAEDLVVIDLADKASFADRMVIASGKVARQLAAMAEHLARKLKEAGFRHVRMEGERSGDWVLVDAGDVVVHLFRPEIRAHYNLEKMWGAALPDSLADSLAEAEPGGEGLRVAG
ncbi:MAG: ribosome silencing factor [Alphaproteobacteria bacterium]|nr:ribosome silencing factor [Alphaproteobacteria bacterium]